MESVPAPFPELDRCQQPGACLWLAVTFQVREAQAFGGRLAFPPSSMEIPGLSARV